jgi:hypothetical protein
MSVRIDYTSLVWCSQVLVGSNVTVNFTGEGLLLFADIDGTLYDAEISLRWRLNQVFGGGT